ncbi:MAG: flagellar basal body rod protein FlgC [Bacillota bacterium]|jgi:flagellar basal-body rod protein FlgC|nr:flagellar basal body rod protein FlgC [Bacillota bacterium]
MGLFTGFEISGSGLTAQRLRLDVIADNIANAETTRSGEVDPAGRPLPYRRRRVIFETRSSDFASVLKGSKAAEGRGVRVKAIEADPRPFPVVYNPDHPDADARGYVRMPNVNIIEEMVDLISASRAYEANVTALNATKEMMIRALEIGRR